MTTKAHVVIVGAGFAGLGCARELAKHDDDVHVTLIDKHDYHQFLPLLYQVATYQLAPADVSADIDTALPRHDTIDVKLGEVASIDPAGKTVTLEDGQTFSGNYLVLAAGSQANFFDTPGSEHVFPLYSLDDARRLRSRILAVFEDAERDPSMIDEGALNFVIVGAGATGTEVAGALAELISDVLPSALPRPRPGEDARDPGRPGRHRPRPVLAEGARLRLEGPHEGRRRAPPRNIGEGDRCRSRRPLRRRHDPHALRDLGRRDQGGRAGGPLAVSSRGAVDGSTCRRT